MGKALQSPEDAVIDLTADEQASSPDASVWGRPPGQDLQSRVSELQSIFFPSTDLGTP